MTPLTRLQSDIFLDTSYALALSSSTDEFYGLAKSYADQIERSRRRVVTTRAVTLEIGNALSRRRFRQQAISLLAALEADSKIEIIPLSEELYVHAFELYRTRPDKEWSLVDCISFVVMNERGITEALTADRPLRAGWFHTATEVIGDRA